MRAETHSGDPAANAKTSGGSPSLSNTSTFASLCTKIASTRSALPRLQAKWRAVWPSRFWASKSEDIALLPFPNATFARRSLIKK